MAASKLAPQMFIPALPTLWPSMILRPGSAARVFPFSAPEARYYYFARIGIWQAARELGLAEGEVLVPAYHHGVEIEALAAAGAGLRFYRVGRRWDVDLEDVRRKIGPRTRALYLVHYAGFPGPVDEMKRLAEEHGLPLIEDCALALLSSAGRRPLGTTGDVSVFCLYKTLPVPNGGMLVINTPRKYDVTTPPEPPLLSTFSHLMSSLLQNVELRGGGPGRYIRARVRGLGRRAVETASIERVTTGSDHFNPDDVDLGMSRVARRILNAQDAARIIRKRRRNYKFLLQRLRDVSPPLFETLPPGVCPLFYPLVVEDKAPIMARLEAMGIESIDFWRYFHPACRPEEFPDTAWLRQSILEIPCHQDLTLDMVDDLAEAVRDALFAERSILPGAA